MLGRGLVSRPDLARQIAAARAGAEVVPMSWEELLPLLRDFWLQARRKLAPRYAPGRLKQWLAMLTRSYPEAVALFAAALPAGDLPIAPRALVDLVLTVFHGLLVGRRMSSGAAGTRAVINLVVHGLLQPVPELG